MSETIRGRSITSALRADDTEVVGIVFDGPVSRRLVDSFREYFEHSNDKKNDHAKMIYQRFDD